MAYRRTPQKIRRLVVVLAAHSPYHRGAPPGLPFRWDEDAVGKGLNFTLTSSFGDIDLLGEIAGGGGYDALAVESTPVAAFGVEVLCLNLERRIRVKRAAGRPRDLEAIAELEALLEERDALED